MSAITAPVQPKEENKQEHDSATKESISIPIPPEGWTRCHYYVESKGRFCKQRPANGGTNYCGTHTHYDVGQEVPPTNSCDASTSSSTRKHNHRKRVACPLDPSHSVYEDTLSKHMKVCPHIKRRKTQEQESYYRCNMNLGGHGEKKMTNGTNAIHNDLIATATATATASTILSVEWAKRLALRILEAYQRLYPMETTNILPKTMRPAKIVQNLTLEQIHKAIPLLDLSKPELEAGLPESVEHHRVKSGGERHLWQQASLIGHLRRIGVLPPLGNPREQEQGQEQEGARELIGAGVVITQGRANHEKLTILELGAGRGMLGLVAAGAAAGTSAGTSHSNVELVLVERSGCRSKAEKVLRTAKKHNNNNKDPLSTYLKLSELEWKRIRCDLAHVHMPTVLAELEIQTNKNKSKNNSTKKNNDTSKEMHQQESGDGESACSEDVTYTTLPSQAIVNADGDDNKETSVIAEGSVGNGKVIVVTKHLCGAGTDLALRSLQDISPRLDACVMATCCHGVCNWDDYVGRDFLCREILQGDSRDPFHFGKAEFDLLRRWTSGTVASDGISGKVKEAEIDNNHIADTAATTKVGITNDSETSNNVNRDSTKDEEDQEHPLVQMEDAKDAYSIASIVKELELACGVQGLGRACQRLIDHGRCEYMRTVLFQTETSTRTESDTERKSVVVELSQYVPPTVTPQNAVLIAYRK